MTEERHRPTKNWTANRSVNWKTKDKQVGRYVKVDDKQIRQSKQAGQRRTKFIIQNWPFQFGGDGISNQNPGIPICQSVRIKGDLNPLIHLP